jgi:hypothetical protein
MPDGTYISSISGQVQFGDAINQHARVFQKPLIRKFYDVTYDSGANLFTVPAGSPMPAADTQLSLGSTSNSYPAGYSHDVPYYRVNVSGQTFQLSKYDGGTAEIFTSNGANLGLYEYEEWQDTGIDIIPQ